MLHITLRKTTRERMNESPYIGSKESASNNQNRTKSNMLHEECL